MEKWIIETKRADFNAIAKAFHISPVTARLIRNRDVIGEDQVRLYLYGSKKDLHPAQLMKDLDLACDILLHKIEEKKPIRIVGDYDIDGVCATFILKKGLIALGALADAEIPHRILDGYGINERIVKDALADGIDTILTCDNGISAYETLKTAKENGLTVIVTDHHEVPFEETLEGKREILPPADAVVDPKRSDCHYPYESLCGAAVSYKLIQRLYTLSHKSMTRDEEDELLSIAGLATVGDVMPLTGENRILVKEGIACLKGTGNVGLHALMEATGIDRERLSAYHLGFIIGPCLNAGGRLDTAKQALSLLESKDKEEADRAAAVLKDLNDQRKDMTKKATEQAVFLVESAGALKDKVLVIYLEDCHESLAGIVAGRIREMFHHPVFVITQTEHGLKGSGRSIPAYSMYEGLCTCKDLLVKFGGHPMAAGISLEADNLQAFRERINETAMLGPEDFIPQVRIDVAMPVQYADENFIRELSLLEPFGNGNAKPMFAEPHFSILKASRIGNNEQVLKFKLKNPAGFLVDAIYFGDCEAFDAFVTAQYGKVELRQMYLGEPNRVDLAFTYYPDINEFRGKKTVQIVIKGFCRIDK